MSISLATRQAYSEVDTFLEIVSPEEREKIPQKLKDIFREEKDNSYKKIINADVPIIEQNLKEETLSIISLLNLQYWCEDESEKERLRNIYNENERKYQTQLREKYNPDNLFKSKTSNIETEQIEKVSMIEYKESIFTRILNRIRKIFKRD